MTKMLKNLIVVLTIFVSSTYYVDSDCTNDKVVFEMYGNLSITFLLNEHSDLNCQKQSALGRTQITAATWIIKRLKELNYTNNISIGAKIYDTCLDDEKTTRLYLKSLLQEKNCARDSVFLGTITSKAIGKPLRQLSKVLKSEITEIPEIINENFLISIVTKFISIVGLNQNVILVTNHISLSENFMLIAKHEWICVQTYVEGYLNSEHLLKNDNLIIVFGTQKEIQSILNQHDISKSKSKWLIVPIDGAAEYYDIPDGAYIVLPTYADVYQIRKNFFNFVPSPVFFSIAKIILNKIEQVQNILTNDCFNDTDHLTCLEKVYPSSKKIETDYQLTEILELLKIEPLYDKFSYDILRLVNDEFKLNKEVEANTSTDDNIIALPYVNDFIFTQNIAQYIMFNDSLIYDQHLMENDNSGNSPCNIENRYWCTQNCINFGGDKTKEMHRIENKLHALRITWRQDAWVSGIASVAAIGFLSCLAVLIFILVRICKGDILEGNPVSSILLLLTLMLMYSSILPFSIEIGNTKIVNILKNGPDYAYIMQEDKSSSEYFFQNTTLPTNLLSYNSSYNSNINPTTGNAYYTTEISKVENYETTINSDLNTLIFNDSDTTSLNEINNNNIPKEIIKSQLDQLENFSAVYNDTETTDPFDGNTSLSTEESTNYSEKNTFSTEINNSNIETTSVITTQTAVMTAETTDRPTNPVARQIASSKEFEQNKQNKSKSRTEVENENITISFSSHPSKEFENNIRNLVCTCGVFSVSVSYTLAFSLMLARFIMVASVGHDGGFMSHVNGYIQTTLCFFITVVQIGLSLQLWLIYQDCTLIFTGYLFIFLISYDVFLLVLLLLVCPFVARSQRNYKEGILFTVAVVLIATVWTAWITFYLLIKDEWKDAVISAGLVATATVILITVFIPRTYLMMTAIVRDNLTNALPNLAHMQSTSVLDLNYRNSSQAIYDCVNPVAINARNESNEVSTIPIRGQINPNYYSEETNEDNDSIENTYARYDTPPSPSKMTRF